MKRTDIKFEQGYIHEMQSQNTETPTGTARVRRPRKKAFFLLLS
jgi:hypothetical protein